jgi:2-dehydropantoate 2-reductase
MDLKEIRTVAIVGAGALGAMYGNHMIQNSSNNHLSITFIADPGRIERYKREGLIINEQRINFDFIDPDSSKQPFDLIIFATKYTTLKEAISFAAPFVGEETIIMSLLNGISSEEDLYEAYHSNHILYSFVHGTDSTKLGNILTHTGIGTIVYSSKDGDTADPDVLRVAKLFDDTKITYDITEDIHRRMWSKLMLNTGVNQVCAVYESPYKRCQTGGDLLPLMIEVMREVTKIAASKGVLLTEEDIEEWVQILDKLTPTAYPSMAQDILSKRKTEVDLFSGTMMKIGEENGIEVPRCRELYEKIKEKEADFR